MFKSIQLPPFPIQKNTFIHFSIYFSYHPKTPLPLLRSGPRQTKGDPSTEGPQLHLLWEPQEVGDRGTTKGCSAWRAPGAVLLRFVFFFSKGLVGFCMCKWMLFMECFWLFLLFGVEFFWGELGRVWVSSSIGGWFVGGKHVWGCSVCGFVWAADFVWEFSGLSNCLGTRFLFAAGSLASSISSQAALASQHHHPAVEWSGLLQTSRKS